MEFYANQIFYKVHAGMIRQAGEVWEIKGPVGHKTFPMVIFSIDVDFFKRGNNIKYKKIFQVTYI